jgi:hypothetical protein
MNKKFILVGAVALSPLVGNTQTENSLPTPEKINNTEIEILYNHYLQDGNKSPVTGGEGTQKLSVYGPSSNVNRTIGKNKVSINVGVDIITSASTDNINFVVSSASLHDTRGYFNAGYARAIGENKLTLSGGGGMSVESEYLSISQYLGLTKESKDEMRSFSLKLQAYNDDLRWGRFSEKNGYKADQLIYPRELRNQEWFDIYKRYSYQANIGYTQIIDKRNILGVFLISALQSGLLSTPFHRIYFEDGSLAVEKLPNRRYKNSLGLKWNRFTGGKIILKNAINGYVDNFGVAAFSLKNETIIKLNYKWSLTPNLRFYTQRGSRYFAPKSEHRSDAEFYTSDYDLSDFKALTVGMGVRYRPVSEKRTWFKSIALRYFHYRQSTGLRAHSLSLTADFKYKNRKRSERKK